MDCANGDVLRVAARLSSGTATDVVNVFHFKLVAAAPIPDNTIGSECGDNLEAIYTPLVAHIPTTVTFEDINVFNVTQDRPLGVFTWPTLLTGNKGVDHKMPAQLSAMVRFPTGYSKSWGRKFFGPFSEAANTENGTIEAALLTVLGTVALEVLAPHLIAGTDKLETVVYNKNLAQFVPVIDAVIKNVWSTVKTRRTGRGS